VSLSRDTVDCYTLESIRSFPILKPLDFVLEVKEDLTKQILKVIADTKIALHFSAMVYDYRNNNNRNTYIFIISFNRILKF
jgi:hypothetical protein